jgi:hypothetical protein
MASTLSSFTNDWNCISLKGVVAVRKDRCKMTAGVGSNAMLWLSCSLREIKDGLRGQGIDPRKLLDRIGRIA